MSPPGTASDSARATMIAALTAALLVAQQVGAKAARDALFLTHFAPSALPSVMGAGAVLGIGSALVSGRWMARVGPSRCVPWLFALHASAFALEYLAAARAPAQVAVVLYLHIASLGAVATSGFWSAINESFDPYTAKRVIGRIGAGATLGGVLGGVATERLGRSLPIAQMLLGFALLNFVLAAGTWLLRSSASARNAPSEPSEAGIVLLRRTPYLRDLAIMVVLLAIADTLVDYLFKAEAGRAYGQGEALLAFFALFYTVTAILTFAVQWGLNRVVLARLGLGGAVALLPGAMLVTSAMGVAAPGLAALGLLRGATSVLESSLYRSGYELLFTPLAPAQKRATKALLDVAIGRVGAVVGSVLIVALLAIGLPYTQLLVTLILCAALCGLSALALLLALRLHAGYVQKLADSLRDGVVRLDPSEILDPATRRTLAESAVTIDRAELLRKLEAMKRTSLMPPAPVSAAGSGSASASASGSGSASDSDSGSDSAADSDSDSGKPTLPAAPTWVARAAALSGTDLSRARSALSELLAPELIATAIAQLANDPLAPALTIALKAAAPRCTGQLIDALLDRERPVVVRRRIPPILEAVSGERVQRGLFAALDDPAVAVRARAAQALAAVVERAGPSALSEAEIFAAIRRELDRGTSQRDAERVLGVSDPAPPFLPVARSGLGFGGTAPALRGGVVSASPGEASRAPQAIQIAFALLGVCLEREAVALSLHAILGPDSHLRGTALEYLDNVLPADLRERLWPFLRAARSERPKRPRSAIVEELITSSAGTRAPVPSTDS